MGRFDKLRTGSASPMRPLRNLGVVARKTLTPTLSHGEREKEWPHLEGRGTFCQGLPGGRAWRNPGMVARKTPHRFRPKTPESFGKLRTGSASPLGEGEEPRPPTVLVAGAMGARKTLTPALSHGEREEEGPRFRGRGAVLQRSPRGEGGRGAAALRTPGGYMSLRRGRRAGDSAWVAGDVARLLGPAATLTPTHSHKGEGGRGGSVWVRRLRGRPSPQPSPTGRGRKRGPAFEDAGLLCKGLLKGEGERAAAISRSRGVAKVSTGRGRKSRPNTVAHRFRPRTAESFGRLRTGSASPLGEGKNGGRSRRLTRHSRSSGFARVSGEGVRAATAWKTRDRCAYVSGEGNERRHLEGIDTVHRSIGLRKGL